MSDRTTPPHSTSGPDPSHPATCPACKSTQIVTTGKSPNADSYWRCNDCGEVWNVGRRSDQAPRAKAGHANSRYWG